MALAERISTISKIAPPPPTGGEPARVDQPWLAVSLSIVRFAADSGEAPCADGSGRLIPTISRLPLDGGQLSAVDHLWLPCRCRL